MWFWKKDENRGNIISGDDGPHVTLKMFTDLLQQQELLKVKIEILQTNMDNLRGQFNRKLKGLKTEDITEEEKAKTETLINGNLVGIG